MLLEIKPGTLIIMITPTLLPTRLRLQLDIRRVKNGMKYPQLPSN
jgi:hypothetical protein